MVIKKDVATAAWPKQRAASKLEGKPNQHRRFVPAQPRFILKAVQATHLCIQMKIESFSVLGGSTQPQRATERKSTASFLSRNSMAAMTPLMEGTLLSSQDLVGWMYVRIVAVPLSRTFSIALASS